MAVRKTESQLPDGLTAGDLGQFSTAPTNPKIILVSFHSSPIAVRRTQTYVVFVTDSTAVDEYEWTFSGTSGVVTTEAGIVEFTPQGTGNLTVTVKLKKVGGGTAPTVSLTQKVVALNGELELLIDQTELNAPKGAHPETSRELVNDLRGYVNLMFPGPADEQYNTTLSSLAYARCLTFPKEATQGAETAIRFRRHLLLEKIAALLNAGKHKAFLSETKNGFGICKTRPQLLAMYLDNPATGARYITRVELPKDKRKQGPVLKAIAKAFDDLTEQPKIDLFNRLRFPKSHFAMARLILDGLLTDYFSGTAAQVLKEKKKAIELLSQFETGPIAKVKATSDSGKVVDFRASPVWKVKVVAIGGATGGGAGAVGTPGPVGIPETVPDMTFIASATPFDNGFLEAATQYHNTFGLAPKVVTSFENLVQQLSASTAPIKRLRLVTHFFLDEKKKGSNVVIPMFENIATTKPFFSAERYDYAFGDGDDAGLLAHFEGKIFPQAPGILSDQVKTKIGTSNTSPRKALHVVLFKVLKNRGAAELTPFKFKSTGPSGAGLTLFQLAADIVVLDNATMQVEGHDPPEAAVAMPAPVKAAWRTHLLARIDKLKPKFGNKSGDVDPLVAKITSLTFADLIVPIGSATVKQPIRGVFLRPHPTFKTDVAKVRNRLKNGAVDIRGCQIGVDKEYMKAVRRFFGPVGQEPKVTAPEWFQSFGVLPTSDLASEGEVDVTFLKGITVGGDKPNPITGADVQRAYSDWSGMIGLNAQLSFWATLFSGDELAFLDVTSWKDKLPPIGMEAARVKDLASINYPDLLSRLREVFFVPNSTGPSGSQAMTFISTVQHVATLRAAIDNVGELTASSPQTAIDALFASIQGLANTLSQTLPQPVPSPVTIAHLNACTGALRTFLLTTSNIAPLKTALKAKSDDPKFGIRTMMGSGLPLVIQRASKEGLLALIYLKANREEALKSLLTIHWAAPLPAAVSAAIAALSPTGPPTTDGNGTPTNDTARGSQLSTLESDERVPKTAFNPENEFAKHIIREPA